MLNRVQTERVVSRRNGMQSRQHVCVYLRPVKISQCNFSLTDSLSST